LFGIAFFVFGDVPMRRELEPVLALAKILPAAELPAFIGALEEIKTTALTRISNPTIESRPDELLTVAQLSARLNVSKDYVYRNKKRFQSFARPQGRKLLFSSSGLDLYLKQKR
jgi:excisionase family DNA binding protein